MTGNGSDPRSRRSRRTQRQRQPSISISLGNRGQTTQDFAVGIGVFILAVAFVFSFLPSIVTPYDSSVGGAETAQADRVADRVLEALSTGAQPNEIDVGKIDSEWENDDAVAETFGLRTADGGSVPIDRMNVTIQELDTDDPEPAAEDWTFGHTYDDQPAASSIRIVSVKDDTAPAYRLVVRIW